jgi:hypothetical protein
MQEVHSKMKAVPCIDPAVIYNSNGTKTGAIINAAGYSGIEFVLTTGVLTDGTWTTAVYGSNDSGMAGEVQLTVDGGAHPGLISADLAIAITDDSITDRQGVDVDKAGFQYYRFKATQAAATTGGYISVAALLVNPHVMPVAAQAT